MWVLSDDVELTVTDGGPVGWDQRGLHVIDVDAMEWQVPFSRASAGNGRATTDAERAGAFEKPLVVPEGIGEDRPLVTMLRLPPNFSFPQHWHTEGEFIYILSGEAHFGSATLGPGGMAYADARCLYGAETAGDKGCEFLLIRRANSLTTVMVEASSGAVGA